ncbi:hypothetical protein HK405_000850, partial [Cladochytrium tenue]
MPDSDSLSPAPLSEARDLPSLAPVLGPEEAAPPPPPPKYESLEGITEVAAAETKSEPPPWALVPRAAVASTSDSREPPPSTSMFVMGTGAYANHPADHLHPRTFNFTLKAGTYKHDFTTGRLADTTDFKLFASYSSLEILLPVGVAVDASGLVSKYSTCIIAPADNATPSTGSPAAPLAKQFCISGLLFMSTLTVRTIGSSSSSSARAASATAAGTAVVASSAPPPIPPSDDTTRLLTCRMSDVSRAEHGVLPRRWLVEGSGATVRLDLRAATFQPGRSDIVLNVAFVTIKIMLPPGIAVLTEAST